MIANINGPRIFIINKNPGIIPSINFETEKLSDKNFIFIL